MIVGGVAAFFLGVLPNGNSGQLQNYWDNTSEKF